MSNADEDCHCKYCDTRRAAQSWPPEPAPQPEPSNEPGCWCSTCLKVGIYTASCEHMKPAPQRLTDDERKVAELVIDSLSRFETAPDARALTETVAMVYATGKTNAARRIERLRKKLDKAERQRDEARADLRIARRGSSAHSQPCMREECAVRSAEADPNYPNVVRGEAPANPRCAGCGQIHEPCHLCPSGLCSAHQTVEGMIENITRELATAVVFIAENCDSEAAAALVEDMSGYQVVAEAIAARRGSEGA